MDLVYSDVHADMTISDFQKAFLESASKQYSDDLQGYLNMLFSIAISKAVNDEISKVLNTDKGRELIENYKGEKHG
jgi:hypothetical protein